MKTHLLLSALIVTICTDLQATPQKKDPIDIAMNKAMEKNPSTGGMVQAAAQADKKWQKEIDRALANLQKAMSAEQWNALQASQEAWRAYRDKELATQGALYGAMQGTMWRPVVASQAMELDRARALLLRDYIETLSER
jgi:uncharacterized protein YecT (DUF1311 family)